MKIVFLDIDGVIIWIGKNMRKSRSEKRKGGMINDFDEELALNLKHLIKETGAKIVISSSWRHNMERCKIAFDESVLDWNDVISKTPCSLGHGRGNEILTWLNDYHKTCKAGHHITDWIAIDDDSFDMKSINRLGKFIHTPKGLTKDKMKEAILNLQL